MLVSPSAKLRVNKIGTYPQLTQLSWVDLLINKYKNERRMIFKKNILHPNPASSGTDKPRRVTLAKYRGGFSDQK